MAGVEETESVPDSDPDMDRLAVAVADEKAFEPDADREPERV